MNRPNKYFENCSSREILSISFLLIILAWLTDYLIGPDASSSLFYIIPITIASWYGSQKAGLAISIISAILWLIAEKMFGRPYENWVVFYWNGFVRLSLFILISWLFSSLRQKLREAEALADFDGLTGILNGRAFYKQAEKEILRLRRYGRQFTVAYIDLDNFKYINDQYGHAIGDELLQAVANTMKRNVRDVDLLARLGGDEFAILFLETNSEDSIRAFLKLRQMLLSEMEENSWPVSISAGLVTYEEMPENVKQMLMFADELMYRVKNEGKNGALHATFQGSDDVLRDAVKILEP